ncbi:MAG: deoxyribodipyrimidine photo-lyase [Bacteroidales bacterium]|nr:MAG: deoxyribodipyrimidine photo-lyase [Bacteroidales bacterium]
MLTVNNRRVRVINEGKMGSGSVAYWMSREQRVSDSWALLYAIERAKEFKRGLVVIFTLAPAFSDANLRHYDFMLKGLREVEKGLAEKGVLFSLLMGEPSSTLSSYIISNNISLLVSDFDPLKVKRNWKDKLNHLINIPHHEVDAHNIAPCWIASDKLEFGAYTLRPKIKKYLPEFLDDYPEISNSPMAYQPANWDKALSWLNPCNLVKPITWIKPGENEARNVLLNFINTGLNGYAARRNNPNLDGQSNLSPYLHFGQLSAQRVTIEVMKSAATEEDKSAFLEELIVRRELSDNFCYYNPNYDSLEGFHRWAKETHKVHRRDKREFNYSIEEFELGKTHDPLWNAAQNEMLITGKMHGFMRMYWAKKILEWTSSPEEAMRVAIYLNDKYSLDGRDPNGYAGIAWSIGGVHDRAWGEREVYGKIRYMNYNGCKRKFDVDSYINRMKVLQ